MEEPTLWLAQGDLFEAVPFVRMVQDGLQVHPAVGEGPALLLTEGCQLDKPTPQGLPGIVTLQFAPVRPITAVTEGVRDALRRYQINPPAAVYINDVGDGQEGIALLTETFGLPASYFEPELMDYAGTPGVGSDSLRLHARRHGERLGGMSHSERLLLHDKLTVFWTRLRAEGARLFDPPYP